MMDVVLVSVPHTGTTFTEALLCDRGWHTGLPQDRSDGRTIHRVHCTEMQHVAKALQKVREGHPLICPLRHPYLVEESWKRRGKEIAPMIEAFRLLYTYCIPRNPLIMAVDSVAREGCLKLLSAALDVELTTDWSPERSISGTYDLSFRDMNASDEVLELADEMAPLLSQYYA